MHKKRDIIKKSMLNERNGIKMAEITVKFLGSNFTFPEELKQYIIYCSEFEKISDRLSQALLKTMKNPNICDGESSQLWDIDERLRQKVRDEGKKLISMLAKHNIFDVTESDVVDNNQGYHLYDKAYNEMFAGLRINLANEIQNFNDNFENVQRSAYSQVTGTGISMYSNSIIAHMTLAAFETSTVKKQCDKADKDYERAMDNLISSGRTARAKADAKVMMETYPKIAEAFGVYVAELMETYLNKLQANSVFDYSKVKPYSIKRSSELLNNIVMVDDKKSVLEQAFKSCPYNPDIYAKVLELGICDVDTFATAKEFYQDSLIVGVVKDYCKKHLKDYDKVKEPIAILALYKGKTETEILRSLYSGELDSVESKYRTFEKVVSNQRALDEWIRKNIGQQTQSVISTSVETIKNKVHSAVSGIISESNYQKFADMGLLSIETLRLKDSTQITLKGVNEEIEMKLVDLIIAYIEEAKTRKKKSDDTYAQFDAEVKKKNEAIAEKQSELNVLGIFAFSKKKELKAIIADMESDLSKYKYDKEPKDLQRAFEKMYG